MPFVKGEDSATVSHIDHVVSLSNDVAHRCPTASPGAADCLGQLPVDASISCGLVERQVAGLNYA